MVSVDLLESLRDCKQNLVVVLRKLIFLLFLRGRIQIMNERREN